MLPCVPMIVAVAVKSASPIAVARSVDPMVAQAFVVSAPMAMTVNQGSASRSVCPPVLAVNVASTLAN